jgi:hypothetical protein
MHITSLKKTREHSCKSTNMVIKQTKQKLADEVEAFSIGISFDTKLRCAALKLTPFLLKCLVFFFFVEKGGIFVARYSVILYSFCELLKSLVNSLICVVWKLTCSTCRWESMWWFAISVSALRERIKLFGKLVYYYDLCCFGNHLILLGWCRCDWFVVIDVY